MADVFWSLLNSFLNKALSAVFLIVLGNLLLPVELGVYVSIVLLLTYGTVFFSLRTDVALVQKLNDSSKEEERSNYFTAGVICTLVLGLLAVVTFYFIHDVAVEMFKLQEHQNLFWISVPLVFLTLLEHYFNRTLQADLKLRTQALINLGASALRIATSLSLIAAGHRLTGLLAGMYVGAIFGASGLGIVAWRMHGFVATFKTLRAAADLFRFGSIIYVGGIAVFLDQKIDMFFINLYQPKDDLAIYNYALNIGLMMVVFGTSISRVTYPKLASAFSVKDTERVESIFSDAINYSFALLGVGALIVTVNANYIIGSLLPPPYLSMIASLSILVSGLLLKSTVASVGALFTARGIPQYSLVVKWFVLGVNVVLNLLLIPRYGIEGAALATSASFVLKPLLMLTLTRVLLNIRYTYARLVASYCLFVAVVGAAYYLETFWFSQAIIPLFGIFCWLCVLSRQQRQRLWAIASQYCRLFWQRLR
jgi:O-antigen/teichoic acid export membrane protein